LGGPPRRIGPSLGSADVSPDGRELAFFRDLDQSVELVVSSRDGSAVRRLTEFPRALLNYYNPRWSPDQKWIAFVRVGTNFTFVGEILAVPAAGGDLRQILPDENFLRGFDWLPDGSGILYSSSRGSTIPYVPRVNLWSVSLGGGNPRQITFGVSYVEPDINASGTVVAGERTIDFDIWKFPVDGTPESNVRRAERVTRHTGHVYTPSPSPDDSELAYLSDSGGHANLWITTADGEKTRQITFERDPLVIIGLPRWSPDGSRITFYVENARDTARSGQWLVNPDGSDLRYLVFGAWADWSSDGRWLYYSHSKQGVWHIEKVRWRADRRCRSGRITRWRLSSLREGTLSTISCGHPPDWRFAPRVPRMALPNCSTEFRRRERVSRSFSIFSLPCRQTLRPWPCSSEMVMEPTCSRCQRLAARLGA
jgi:Tol biopolymer transport system component